jgi:hypothetical protein
MKLKPEAILELLRTEAVLLPIRKGTKAPTSKGWSTLAFGETQTPRYQASLERAGAIGVLLGSRSGNLCSIDFDDNEALAEFLSLNPSLAHSLRTTGRRGANIWLKLRDPYPSTFNFQHNGSPAGEWRADRSQTVITGRHPEGGAYQVTVNAPPMLVTFKEINWGELQGMKKCHIDGINGLDNKETQILKITQKKGVGGRARSLVERIKGAERALTELKGQPRLAKLYRTFIARKFAAQQGERNSQLVAMTTFLFRATSEETTAALVLFFYDLNQDVFSDSREMHENEMRSHLDATRRTWLESLGKEERRHYMVLVEISRNHAAAFRVCRELAGEDGTFFLSCAELGKRIDLDGKQAQRLLGQLVGLEIIKVMKKGTQHRTIEQDGEKIVQPGKATDYRWLLRNPCQP